MEVSAKTGKKISDLFDSLLDMVVEKEGEIQDPFGQSGNQMNEANEISGKI